MEKISPCRCGAVPHFTPYYQSIDGNHDTLASVTCRTCGRSTVMGWDLWREVEDEVGDEKYDGHTAYLSKRFIEALGDATIRKWNRENGPDGWELLEEDAGCTATKYNERRGTIFTTKQQVARDLVRRARALAERDA